MIYTQSQSDDGQLDCYDNRQDLEVIYLGLSYPTSHGL
jgi:hypothetical protein